MALCARMNVRLAPRRNSGLWEQANELRNVLAQHFKTLESCIERMEQLKADQHWTRIHQMVFRKNVELAFKNYIRTKICYIDLIPKHSSISSDPTSQRTSRKDGGTLEGLRWSRLRQERLGVYLQQLKLLENSFRDAVTAGRKSDAATLFNACQELKEEIQYLQNPP
jgi:hypothetical protein